VTVRLTRPIPWRSRFDGETSQVEDMVRLATFYDPDGNALMLAQQLK
jgi:hypothetical protein